MRRVRSLRDLRPIPSRSTDLPRAVPSPVWCPMQGGTWSNRVSLYAQEEDGFAVGVSRAFTVGGWLKEYEAH